MASRTVNGDRAQVGARTLRRDRWWLSPLVTVAVLGGFVVYGTWVAFSNRDYFADPYLSPFYSPCLAASCAEPTWAIVGSWWPLSPALLVLPFPLGFRLTCYYYRKAYYRSFWLAPAACAVRDAKAGYSGETRFPLIVQNFHRYAWYVAVFFIAVLTWDALLAFRFPSGFGIGVGTVVMWINVLFLAGYTFSCHSCRHVCGGHVDIFSKAPGRHGLWRLITRLNEKHPVFAWLSLWSVGLTDLYIRLVSMGVIRDWRII
jgi:hypothetical protein